MADGREEKDRRPQHLKPRDSGLPDAPARRPAPPYVAPPGYVAPIPEEPAPAPAAHQLSPPPDRQPSSDDEDEFQEAEQHHDEAEEQPADEPAPDNEDNDNDPEDPHDAPAGNDHPVPPPAADMAQPQAVQPNQLTLLPTFDGVRGESFVTWMEALTSARETYNWEVNQLVRVAKIKGGSAVTKVARS